MSCNLRRSTFEPQRFRAYVVFYSRLTSGRLVPDLAQKPGSFADQVLFRARKMKERFSVDYRTTTPPSGPDHSEGQYYGFIIGLYYDHLLQDTYAEPSSLTEQQPLPRAIE